MRPEHNFFGLALFNCRLLAAAQASYSSTLRKYRPHISVCRFHRGQDAAEEDFQHLQPLEFIVIEVYD